MKDLPEFISREEYADVRSSYRANNNKYPDWYIGAIGFLASYNGKFFGGYAGIVHTKIGTDRNYYDEAKRNLLTQIQHLQGIQWSVKDYKEYFDIVDSLIYCDIPYQGTTDYGLDFDHKTFWEWANKMSERNIVLVSEEKAPENWTAIWQQEIKRTLDNASRIKSVEKLFKINN